MAVLGDLLFYRGDRVGLGDVLRHQLEQLRNKVDALSDQLFAEKSDEEIAALIAGEQTIAPLVADFAGATAAVRETQVEVLDRFGLRHGSVRVAGLEATKTIPFTGDPNLWRLHPNYWSSNPPRGDVRGDKLVIGITVPADQADEAAQYIDRTIAQLPEYITKQRALLDDHNASLASQAMPSIKARRQRLGTASDLLKKLGG
ncbi:MAG: hypothetical protein U1E59_14310 [Amaricoccus sp.]|uniref:hypothetical protein n=1 Tax=Amaricoccus sp. TaxID=1872485 RepID=UPI003314F0A8